MDSMINTNSTIISTIDTRIANANLNAEPLRHKTEWLKSFSAKTCAACCMSPTIHHQLNSIDNLQSNITHHHDVRAIPPTVALVNIPNKTVDITGAPPSPGVLALPSLVHNVAVPLLLVPVAPPGVLALPLLVHNVSVPLLLLPVAPPGVLALRLFVHDVAVPLLLLAVAVVAPLRVLDRVYGEILPRPGPKNHDTPMGHIPCLYSRVSLSMPGMRSLLFLRLGIHIHSEAVLVGTFCDLVFDFVKLFGSRHFIGRTITVPVSCIFVSRSLDFIDRTWTTNRMVL
ncbi:hypothetical protein BDZ45DRAFT_240013 [Acephala macrosclerotiorum]|nr:hypothetical protein BDZ45DRAFT_240013 [Acephala macrosclerotiorum]